MYPSGQIPEITQGLFMFTKRSTQIKKEVLLIGIKSKNYKWQGIQLPIRDQEKQKQTNKI